VISLTAKMSRQEKAISPILATLLLVVIAVAAIVVTYAWIMTYMNNANQQAGVRLRELNVSFYDSSDVKKIAIDVTNAGTEDTQIIRLYIGTSSANLQNQNIPAIDLPKDGVQTIIVNYNWTAGTAYYFKVSAIGQDLGPWAEQAPSNS
jgi:flagellin-like protein